MFRELRGIMGFDRVPSKLISRFRENGLANRAISSTIRAPHSHSKFVFDADLLTIPDYESDVPLLCILVLIEFSPLCQRYRFRRHRHPAHVPPTNAAHASF